MARKKKISVDKILKQKSDTFLEKIESEIYFKSDLASSGLSFEWLDEVEFACPYLDNVIRNPKVTLITEENVFQIEKAKKVSVESVKDLSKNTHYIEKVDEVTNDVQPSKILVVNREETFNTYENRFIYTLVLNLIRFIMKKEDQLNELTTKDDRILEYKSQTSTGREKVNIEMKITSNELPKENNSDKLEKEVEKIRERIKKIKYYTGSWQRSEFMTSLEKDRVPLVFPPIKKTNMILKNPNFQIATKLWEYIYAYELNDNLANNSIEVTNDNMVTSILDDAFLLDYFVLDSISTSKKMQKENLAKYAVIMLTKQVQRSVLLLLNSGLKITDEEILELIKMELETGKNQRLVGSNDVKKKFKSAMDEYLERINKY